MNNMPHKIKIPGARRIKISSGYIKLDSLLKYAAVTSTGGEAKALIANGCVFVGGMPCSERGKKIKPGDNVRVGGEILIIAGNT